MAASPTLQELLSLANDSTTPIAAPTAVELLWSEASEAALQEAITLYPSCGKQKFLVRFDDGSYKELGT